MTDCVASNVEVCVFRMEGDRPAYLVLRRSERESLYPGLWQIVTGSIEPGEKGLDAALREVREETGVSPERFWVVPFTHAFYDHRRDAVCIVPFFAARFSPEARITLSDEHSRYEWLPFDSARTRLVWPGQREGLGVVDRSIVGGEEASRLLAIPV
jgi:dATP pyrophosphohydrolase